MAYSQDMDPHFTWGTCSNPRKVLSQFRLKEHLTNIPRGGTVLNIGAGIAHSTEAALFIARPDLIVASLDPGYALEGQEADAEEMRDLVLKKFTEEEQAKLKATDAWHTSKIVGYAHDLPFASDSMDLVLSYAAVPDYSFDPELDLDETIRVLKVGGLAINGPISEGWNFDEWNELAQDRLASGAINAYTHNQQLIQVRDETFNAHFTEITK